MNRQRLHAEPAVVTIGFAARPGGNGIAFAAIQPTPDKAEPAAFLRIPFAVRPRPALQGRDVTYAALSAVAETLLARNVRSVVFRIDDARLERDLAARGSLPTPLNVPYVALRCRLNRFSLAHVQVADDALTRDLAGRARAEATLDIAA